MTIVSFPKSPADRQPSGTNAEFNVVGSPDSMDYTSSDVELLAWGSITDARGISYTIADQLPPSGSIIPMMAELAALSSPAAYRVLSRLADTGAVSFAELEEELLGWDDWMGVARLFRAGYAAEGSRHLHLTTSGRAALAALRLHLPNLPQ